VLSAAPVQDLSAPAPFVSSPSRVVLSAAPTQDLSAPPAPFASSPSRVAQSAGPAPAPSRQLPPAPSAPPRPAGATTLQSAFTPRPGTDKQSALATPADGRVGRLGEQLSKLGFPLPPDQVARLERARAALPSVLPIAWLLGVQWVRATSPDALRSLVLLVSETCAAGGGVLDVVDTTGATFLFFGLGSQGACALAAQELRERVEAFADGRTEAPSLAVAITGSRLRADPDSAAEGDGLSTLQHLLRKAQPGQCLLARNVATGVGDLVGTTSAGEDMQLTSRKAVLAAPLPTVGVDPIVKLVDLRLGTLGQSPVPPVVVCGARRSGRTHLAQELARRAQPGADRLVGFSSGVRGAGAPLSAIAELVCQLSETPFDDRVSSLGPALEARGVAPERRQALLAALQLAPTPSPFTTRQVADAVRLVLADLTQGRQRVLLFDGLDQTDAASLEVVKELLQTVAPRELIIVCTSPEQAPSLGAPVSFTLPRLGPAEVEQLLKAAIGSAPADLRDGVLSRSGGLPGVVADLLLLTLSRGAVRPRGDSLTLEGSVPDVTLEALARERLFAEGARVGRLLEAVWLLGDHADAATVAQVLPGVAQEAWPRATSARLLVGANGRARVASAFEPLVAAAALSGPGLALRVSALVAERWKGSAAAERVALALERTAEVQRAGNAWREVAERAVASRSADRVASAQEGMARVLRRHPQRDVPPVLTNRLQLFARAACSRLSLGDVDGAERALRDGFDAKPQTSAPDAELSYAHARVSEARGQADEAAEALAEALAVSKDQPVRAAVLAQLAQSLEARSDTQRALEAWHQALAAADTYLPVAPWFGEVDFRGRVEARIGALFITLTQGTRARTWLLSAAERFKAANAPLFAARVMANVGTLSMQLSSFGDAAQWFGQAAATAEAGGDFLFQAKQLAALARVLSRLQDPRAVEVARQGDRKSVV
jgi:tetratricopeptide (TPR) repeat protein